MTDCIKLSVIIPLFNGASYIKKIISDIDKYNSKIRDSLEVLLIDDGSLDSSEEICLGIVETLKYVRYYKKVNGGIASARNYGLTLARGRYITFADQDDSFLSGYENYLNRCDQEMLDMLITSPYNRSGDSERLNKREFRDEIISDKEQIKKMAGKLIDAQYLSDNSVQFVSTSVWNVIYRRKMLLDNNIRFKAFIDYEDDWIFNIETLLVSNKIGITGNGYYCWNIHQQSESHREKYIEGLVSKRKRWMEWLGKVMQAMNIDYNIQNEFVRNVLNPRNIIICFNNACWRPDVSKEEIITETKKACEEWKTDDIKINNVKEMDWKNKYLLKLLIRGKLERAIIINTRIFKKRFH